MNKGYLDMWVVNTLDNKRIKRLALWDSGNCVKWTND